MNITTSLFFSILIFLPVTSYATELHVAVNGDNANTGSKASPLRTIQLAANLAQPGDVITVHKGVYRERVSPPRGGTSDAKRIVYRAAPGEKVEIKGSEVVKGWVEVQDDVWKATIPNTYFGAFNPYSDIIHGDWFDRRGRDHHTGAVYLNGEWLIEAAKLDEVLMSPGTSPAWLQQAGQQYLINVAWIRPGKEAKGSKQIPANSFKDKLGTQNAPCTEGGECIGFIEHDNWVRYEGINFGSKADNLEIRAAAASDGGIIEVRDGAADGELLGTCSVPNTGGWQSWVTYNAKIKPVSGIKNICLVFRSPKNDALNAGLWFAKVDDTNTTILAQFKSVNPNEQLTEINVRRTVFYPEKTGINYITVRGFTMSQAATPWAPPTAEQVGLIGPHWSKGWIIENNVISHSTCVGVSLGKYGDQFDNTSADSAEGYVMTIERALKNGWNKETIGHHIVRNNVISHCEQAGVVGSLGAAFSTVSGNTIHDIHVRRLFSGAEMAGIKFHAAIDVTISGNHIYRTCLSIWLDWMAQGTRVTRNLLDHNGQDLFVEVDHGPLMIDNNLFLSASSFHTRSQGGAYIHNLFCGSTMIVPLDERLTPYHKPHSTEVAGMHDNPCGDDRYYNNIFVQSADLSQYDKAALPVWMAGNIFIHGAKPSSHEKDPRLLSITDPNIRLIEKADGFYLEADFSGAGKRMLGDQLVTTELLGKTVIAGQAYEHPDGSPIVIDTDYFGHKRGRSRLMSGPFESLGSGKFNMKVW